MKESITNKTHHTDVGQDKSTENKRAPRGGTRVRDPLFHTLRYHKNSKLKAIYADDLVYTWLSLCEFIGAFLSSCRGTGSPGVLCPLALSHSF